MVCAGSRSFEAGIRLTQSGDPLAHGREGFRHSVSSDRLPGACDGAAPAHGEDKDEAESVFLAWDVTQGRILAVFGAEGDPSLEDGALGATRLGDNSGVCGLQRSAEISSEAISGRRCCCVQDGGSG